MQIQKNILAAAKEVLSDIAYPAQCLACKKPGSWICETCEKRHLVRSPPECFVCRKLSAGFKTHESCKNQTNSPLTVVRICWRYSPLPKKILSTAKYRFRYGILKEISKKAAGIISTTVLKEAVLVPIPTTQNRVKNRGFNQTEIIANAIGNSLNLPVHNVISKKGHISQTGKSRKERISSDSNPYTLQNEATLPRSNTPIILIDDVCTTGSTLNSCAQVLENEGFMDIQAVTLFRGAKTQRE